MPGNRFELPSVEAPVRECPYDDCDTSNKRGYSSDRSRGWVDSNTNKVECGDCAREYLVDHSNHIQDNEEALRQEVLNLRDALEEMRDSEESE